MPWVAMARERSRLMSPGWTRARRLRTSSSRMRFIRAIDTTRPPRVGIAPPQSPDPAPRGTTGSPHSKAIRTAIAASRASRGIDRGASADALSLYASYAKAARSAGELRTVSGPSASRSREASDVTIGGLRRARDFFLEKRRSSVFNIPQDRRRRRHRSAGVKGDQKRAELSRDDRVSDRLHRRWP